MQKKIAILSVISVITVIFVGVYCLITYAEIFYSWDEQANSFKKYRAIENLEKESSIIDSKIKLADGVVKISEGLKEIWQSPSSWWVDSFVLADSNNDGVVDLNLSVWKPGNFGESKPFWVKENDMSVKNHFFVFSYVKGVVNPIWQSSNLGSPNCEFTFADVNDDSKNDLVVLEGGYSEGRECVGKYVAVWKWNGWGFSNEWRSEEGKFSNLRIEKNGSKKYIVVEAF